MSNEEKPEIGSITWFDLTVPNAEEVRDFYSKVVGWKSSPVSMGEYDDFAMIAPGSEKVASGICYKRGTNKDLPSQWLIYITVADLDKSLEECRSNGGKVLGKIKNMGESARYCVIEDPAGAVCVLFQQL